MTDDVIKWRQFPRYWSFVRGIHRSSANSPHNDQWRVPLIFSLICAWRNGWVNHRDAGDLRCHRAHYNATVMSNDMLILALFTLPTVSLIVNNCGRFGCRIVGFKKRNIPQSFTYFIERIELTNISNKHQQKQSLSDENTIHNIYCIG